MLPEQLEASGWLEGMSATIIKPHNVSTTLRNTAGRLIDFILVSVIIQHIVKNVFAYISAPWLHHGIHFEISGRPRAEHINVMTCPKPLPIEAAKENYDKFADVENTRAIEEQQQLLNTY